MSAVLAAFRPDRRERVDASAETVLLRLSGTWTASERVEVADAALVALVEGRAQRFPALPDPRSARIEATPDGTPWRAAFPLPRELADTAPALTLVAAGAAPTQLPDALFEAL